MISLEDGALQSIVLLQQKKKGEEKETWGYVKMEKILKNCIQLMSVWNVIESRNPVHDF